jgi:hypothetical protein
MSSEPADDLPDELPLSPLESSDDLPDELPLSPVELPDELPLDRLDALLVDASQP